MYVFPKKDQCSGCTACMHSCPTDAITMECDVEGFKYPIIDDQRCIDCGICRRICPFNNAYDVSSNFKVPLVYAVKNKDEQCRLTSSSGGIFPALAQSVIDKNGVVYGVAFDENFNVKHMKGETEEEILKFKGSKYVQSDLGNIFGDIQGELSSGRYVLFSGTPCQVAGLKAFLRKDYEKLVLTDIVCYGTPSPLVWNCYLTLLEERARSPLTHFLFRQKDLGWHQSRLYAEFQDAEPLFMDPFLDSYNGIFYSRTVLRPACHNCSFANLERPGDLTIGDFWGIEQCKPHFDDDKGVSLVLVNTEQGQRIFEEIGDQLLYEVSSADDAMQRNLQRPTPPSPKREQFWLEFESKGYKYVARKYTTYGSKNRVKQQVLKPILVKLGVFKLLRRFS